MISRHLIKMLVGFVGMGVVGLICLFLISMYEKQNKPQDQNVTPPPTVNTSGVAN